MYGLASFVKVKKKGDKVTVYHSILYMDLQSGCVQGTMMIHSDTFILNIVSEQALHIELERTLSGLHSDCYVMT